VELLFIRHGQPRWSIDGITQPDPVLTDLGHAQAELTAQRLAAALRPVTTIYVSTASRSQQTAEPLAQATGVAAITVPDLVEIQMPDWDGQLEEKVQRVFNEARHRSPEEWWEGLPGGESFRQFHDRVTAALEQILTQHGLTRDGRDHLWQQSGDEGRVAIVAHGGTNAVALSYLLGVTPTPWEWERFVLAHASIARVRAIPLAGAHVFSLRSFNDQEHLPADQRSR